MITIAEYAVSKKTFKKFSHCLCGGNQKTQAQNNTREYISNKRMKQFTITTKNQNKTTHKRKNE